MKHALVTGGCGFLGSAIVKLLIERGVTVRILAVPGEPDDNVRGLDVEILRGDVRKRSDCEQAVAGCDTVFHCAAVYKAYAPDPTVMYEVNQTGTFNMLEACRRAGVGTVVYTASIVSLGRPPVGTVGDENTVYQEWDIDFPYSRSKLHSRKIAEDFASWGLDVRIVCPAIVFGPGDIAPTPSGKLILETLKGGPPIHVPGGAAYVDVRDAALVHVLAAERGKPGERYIAASENMTNEELLRAIQRVSGKERRLYAVPTPVARAIVTAMNNVAARMNQEPQLSLDFFEYSLKGSFFTADKAKRELGATFRPIDDTIRDAIAYFKATGKTA
ncbi:MAG: SDR family NAD(P)-dependent oxidoreductase [Myxococcales bacterium]|nr:SDR family NAD(P)-dependent oxidoreductase [Myxococcales bacterium]